MSPLDLLTSKLNNVKKTTNGLTAKCPAHDDRQNSLSLSEGKDGRALIHCFTGCSPENVVKAVGLKITDLYPQEQKSYLYPPKTSTTAQPTGCSLEDYARTKALPVDFLKNLGLSEVRHNGRPRVEIPYLDATGKAIATRYRCALSKSSDGRDARFFWKTGSKTQLYGLWKLKEFEPPKYLVLVEGESDCHTLWYHGIPALGLPGAATWKEEWSSVLEPFESLYVVIEPDAGGQASLKWIARSRFKNKIRLLDLNPFKDPSEVHLSAQTDFNGFWQKALEAAPLWADKKKADAQKQASETWPSCKALAECPNILDLFSSDLEKAGAVGVEREAKIIFLAVVSRFLSRPISIAVKGPSSAGKSFLVEKVLAFFPSEAYYSLSAMSEKVLAYTEEPLTHRMLVIFEAAGMKSDMASYLIRSLLSEGVIRYETVEKTPNGLQSKKLETPGPTGLIVTTTEISLHPENETRLFSITLKDTAEQTRLIIDRLADRNPKPVDFEKWKAFQVWLNAQDNRVFIPFSETLVKLIPPFSVRLRRDVTQVLNLIEAHAILHQATRKRNAEGMILAEIKDYEAVYALIADTIQQQAGAGINPTMRETVETVKNLLVEQQPDPGPEPFINQTKLGERLRLDKASVSRRIRAASNAGYILNLEERRGKPYRLALGEPMPDALELLPNPEKLAGCAVAVKTEGYK
jgi:DNA-binding Lrp family transcriptional regulator